jgi:hypothetical protein
MVSTRQNGTPSSAAPIAELSVVAFRRSFRINGRDLSAGTRGTVVAAYADGLGYEVEVFEAFHAVVTANADDLAA